MGIGPHHQSHLMPAHRQRMTRLHGLDAIGALERKPDIGEVEDAHRSAPPVAFVAHGVSGRGVW